MNPRRIFLRSLILLAALAAFIPVCAQTTPADTPTYRAGLKSIAVPAPDATLIETGPDYRVLLEAPGGQHQSPGRRFHYSR